MATRYKWACKLLFVVQLVLGWVAVVATIPQRHANDVDGFSGEVEDAVQQYLVGIEWLHHPVLAEVAPSIVFGVSLTLSFVASLDAMLNSRSRWRLLRTAAQQLEAIIWTYRCRTGDFALDAAGCTDDGRAEKQLRAAISAVRQQLLSSANLSQTAFTRAYPLRIFTHHQTASVRSTPDPVGARVLSAEENDHQSPVPPGRYVTLRIHTMLTFYQVRAARFWSHL